ncbi:MAG TPA: arsenate reductase ArsC [Burkholderiales bacterium]|nr:arsenate reductase ArsC [Burkholderiales bacterium]
MLTPYHVLFLCTGNSARSILAEAILNRIGQGRFKAYSAGSKPASAVNRFAIDLLRQNDYPVEGLRSKNWDEFEKGDAPKLDLVITVCDNAAGEECPIWPGQPITAHWGIPDPASVEGSDDEKRRAFLQAFTVLNTRIGLLVNLPIASIDRMRLQEHVRDIAKTSPGN